MWLCGDVLYRQSGNLEARFAQYLVKFARGKHRVQVGMTGALVKFYEETGGAWRAAYLPGKTTRAREVRGGNRRKKGEIVKLKHNIDAAGLTLEKVVAMSAQFHKNECHKYITGTRSAWQVDAAWYLG